jgi:hypothetical protein
LHALWTGSVAINLHQKQALIQREMAWHEYIAPLFLIVGIPMLLHGLYDTLLKKEMNAAALASPCSASCTWRTKPAGCTAQTTRRTRRCCENTSTAGQRCRELCRDAAAAELPRQLRGARLQQVL